MLGVVFLPVALFPTKNSFKPCKANFAQREVFNLPQSFPIVMIGKHSEHVMIDGRSDQGET